MTGTGGDVVGTPEGGTGQRSSVGWWLRAVLSWTFLLAMLAVLLASVVLPRVVGGQAYTVLSGSMQPTLAPGALVVVRPVPVEQVATGEMITYQLESGRAAVVTHRVVSIGYAADGTVRLRTRGDANGAPDPEPVRAEQVRGVVWYSVPWLGHVNTLVRGDQRTILLGLVVATLVGYAAVMFVSAARDRRRVRAVSDEPTPERQAVS
ncbi:MAG: signal peptidase I [Propionibacteriaceae bacterium]